MSLRGALLLLVAISLLAGCARPDEVDGDLRGEDLTARNVHACDAAECSTAGLPNGTVLADASLVSLHNASLNSAGPDRDSALFFYDEGKLDGQWLAWSDARARFEASADVDSLGNVTARHHIGTVTTILVPAAGQITQLQIATAALEGTEATVFYRGSAALVDGVATVAFPVPFKFLVSGEITAQVTPTSRGPGLFVSQKALDHITVETLDGSPSDQTFDFFVQATHAGSEAFEALPAR